MKRAIIVVLLLSLIAVIISCAKNTPDSRQTGVVTDGGNGNGRYKADVPEVRYDGADFTVMCRSTDAKWGEWGLFSEGYDGTVMNDAVYDRNTKVEETLGVRLVFDQIYDTTASNGVFRGRLLENAMSYDYICDISVSGLIDACSLIPNNIFYDLQSVPYVNLEADWWQHKLNDSVRILNRQFFGFNDMLLNDKRDTYLVYFNKTVFDNNRLDYPYRAVYDGTWTNDRLLGYIKDYGADLNGNFTVDTEDRIAYVYYLNDTFFVGAGLTGAALDENGLPYMLDYSTKTENVYDVVYRLINGNEYNTYCVRTNGNDSRIFGQIFDNEGLFMCFHMAHMMTVASEYESSVGIVPCPKYDEEQKEYYSRAGYNGATAITVLKSTGDVERAGIVLETMAAESKNFISPAFYEKLFTDRYTDDEESKDMLDIVIRSEIIDLDQVFQWANILVSTSYAAEQGNASAARIFAKYLTMANRKLESTIDSYLELDFSK
ncbi:MAG: hypothetical protein IKS28_08160 [Clostridia bacterium]|nr:hypothetical protein [Clostridia bacterium]